MTIDASSLQPLEDETRSDSDGSLRARHARSKVLPTYHEDSGEYVSDAASSGGFPAIDLPSIEDVDDGEDEDDPHATEPIPRVQADRVATLGSSVTSTGDSEHEPIAIENAGKKDVKAYLSSSNFKCVSARDPEKLSEYAYAPTDKGFILSVEKPLGNTNYKRMKALLRRRVKPSRFVHSVEVSETAEKMALAYGVDPRVARMAGLLHDWDKALSPKRLRDRIAHYGLDIDGPTQINMPQLLHGPTAAVVLADEFPEFPAELFQAIERHTVGGIHMTPLDMIVFCADKLEPSHDVPVYRELYDQIGVMDLEDIFMAVQREGLTYLLRMGRPLDVHAVEVWNYYCAQQQRDGD
ncbi:bis(5'-nucleosyl)-tetraphosphatase (symmetrical) YqeK [Anaerotardibacter muris]|uniref:bis(5'-nucleosyl)-tetraphosphatase (symmetrical) YqeK n=1 Tax=Anaerotardibacter muris TaxID=2941505 RepID=UPI00204080C2|nr:bis(5'-nucleosyl)-tetraphosphatase (symmetrical) YqeK [Anaerotardibacter muris]